MLLRAKIVGNWTVKCKSRQTSMLRRLVVNLYFYIIMKNEVIGKINIYIISSRHYHTVKIIEIMLSSIIKKFEQKCLKIYYKP